jgi:hypothetical protein
LKFAALPEGALPSKALLWAASRGAPVQQPVVVAAVVVALPVLPPEAAVLPVVLPEGAAAVVAAEAAVAPHAEAAVAPHAEAGALRASVAAEAELLALVEAAAALRAWQRVALPAAQALPAAVRPSAAASVCRQDLSLPWPVPQQQGRFARATRSKQIASQ